MSVSRESRPNIVLILTDDHAAHAISCYGSKVNHTPHMDRLAARGARLDSCFCTNSICSPSRASILSGTYGHVNGVTSIYSHIDYRVPNFPQVLRESGYRTALFGKWHLGETEPHLPRSEDFDAWQVFPGQGQYNDPVMISPDGETTVPGYATDIVTDLSLDWLDEQSGSDPFCLMIHHKAPHRPWVPHPKHRDLYPVGSIAEPDTLFDDYATRSDAASVANMRISDDLPDRDIREEMPPELAGEENREARTRWFYQRYLREYLQTVQSVDDNVGRVLDHLDERGLADNTIVVYTSDQGFFLGDHGWYDKRFIYEESLQMPLMIAWPDRIAPGTVTDEIVTNIDFAATFLEACGIDPGDELPTGQGRSFLPLLEGETPEDWPESMYYRYWEHDDPNHHVWAHYGVRTKTHKLVYFYADGLGTDGSSDKTFPPAWEMYDLVADPNELTNIADDPAHAETRAELERELARLQEQYQDAPYVG
ncbi:sulfatase family protein [Ruania alba]|uniref:Arylsulfatase A n=1 Tax=Ruania alba TaxID=648782 RepID=A0A1H5LVM6_9MICO|nr:sulfatase [Ruania alba]SEE81153.1 Arylsulfatase A [Ruania alba]